MKNYHFKYSTMALLLAAALSACGGGGGEPGSTGTTPSAGTGGSTTTPGTGTGTTPGTSNGVTPGTSTPTPQAAASISFVSATPEKQSIVPKGQGGSGRTEIATLTFLVQDANKLAVAGKKVNFAITPSTADVKLNTASATTDDKGNVTASVNSGSTAVAFRVVATVDGTVFTTRSDQMSVSTGLPTQRGFSLSNEIFNIEGLDRDSGTSEPPTKLMVMMADASGNPVADGAAVTFTTNLGSVGSSDRGGCVTANGGCSVDFRAQNPRVALPGLPATPCNSGSPASVADSTRPGVATICASSTDGATTLFDKTEIFFSGSFVRNVTVDGVKAEIKNGFYEVAPIDRVDSVALYIQLGDANDNPMPYKTKVALDGAPAGVVFTEEEIPNIGPTRATGSQGWGHVVMVTGGGTGASCTPKTVTFAMKTTTPKNDVTKIPIKLSFTCS